MNFNSDHNDMQILSQGVSQFFLFFVAALFKCPPAWCELKQK